MRHSRQTFSLFVLGSLLASCGGEANPTAPSGDRDEPQMERMIRRLPSFKEDIQEILVRRGCTSALNCHGIGQGGLAGVAARVLVHGQQGRYADTLAVELAHPVARALRRYHRHVHIG